jgi:hypothetical protein
MAYVPFNHSVHIVNPRLGNEIFYNFSSFSGLSENTAQETLKPWGIE